MQEPNFLDAIFNPQMAVAGWAKAPDHKSSLKPGMRWIVAFEVILGLAFMALGWALVFLIRSMDLGDEWVYKVYSVIPPQIAYDGLLSEFVKLAVSVGIALLAPLAAAAFVVFLLEREAGVGRRNQLYNTMAKMTLPWSIVGVVPVLGWIVMLVGIVANSWRTLGQIFPGLEWTLRLRGLILGGLAAFLTTVLVRTGLSVLLQPLLAILS